MTELENMILERLKRLGVVNKWYLFKKKNPLVDSLDKVRDLGTPRMTKTESLTYSRNKVLSLFAAFLSSPSPKASW